MTTNAAQGHVLQLTRLFEDLLVGLDHRAQSVQNQRTHLGCAALSRFVVVQRVVGQDEPALLQFQSAALSSGLHLFMQPAWFTNRTGHLTVQATCLLVKKGFLKHQPFLAAPLTHL